MHSLRVVGLGYLIPSQHEKLIGTKKLAEGVMSAEMFAGRNHLLVLNFLYSIKSACYDCSASEDQAVRLLEHFLVGSLQSTFLSYLGVMRAEGSDPELRHRNCIFRGLPQFPADKAVDKRGRGNVWEEV